MLDTFFTQIKVRSRMESGPIGPYLSEIAAVHHRNGYARSTIRRHLRAADRFGAWILKEGMFLRSVSTGLRSHLFPSDGPRQKTSVLGPVFRVGGRSRGHGSRWQTTLSVTRHVASTTLKLLSVFAWNTIDPLLTEFLCALPGRDETAWEPRPKRASLA